MRTVLEDLQAVLQAHHTTLPRLLVSILTQYTKSETEGILLDELLSESHNILSVFCQYSPVRSWITRSEHQRYAQELQDLTQKDNGWHFSALRAHADQIKQFHLEDMATDMEAEAPHLCSLLDTLIQANTSKKRKSKEQTDDPDEDQYWAQLDDLEDENLLSRATATTPKRRASRAIVEQRRADIQRIVSHLLTM